VGVVVFVCLVEWLSGWVVAHEAGQMRSQTLLAGCCSCVMVGVLAGCCSCVMVGVLAGCCSCVMVGVLAGCWLGVAVW
jgi:hypothetical protein